MQRSSSSSSSRGESVVLCYHKLSAIRRTATKGSHVGKKFYGCPLWPNGCRFFQLEEEKHVEFGSRRPTSEVEYLLEDYNEKLKKLKLKNEKLRLEVILLKGEVDKHSKGEKFVMFGLIISWIVFAFSWMFKG